MTPAAVQARSYCGLIPGTTQADCENVAKDVVTGRRNLLRPLGWDMCYRIGTAIPPQGSVLVGAVTCTVEDECDLNLYIYPTTAGAMVLRDRAGEMQTTPIVPVASTKPEPRFFLEHRFQDGGWEVLKGWYDNENDAVIQAATLSKDAICYGMVRVVDRQKEKSC
jgi:hypothetical protein